MSLIQLQQLPICIFGKGNDFQHYQTEELYVHAHRHMTALYLMLLMYNTNDQKMACIMPAVPGEEMCSISDLRTSQELIVLCYTFIFSFHVSCLFELNKKHIKKKKRRNALQKSTWHTFKNTDKCLFTWKDKKVSKRSGEAWLVNGSTIS